MLFRLASMSIALFILVAALVALSLLSAAFYGLTLWRMVKVRRTLPTVRDGLNLPAAAPGTAPRVCVIVPAHNEQDVIADLARSLLAQDYENLRVVFALDRCTDGTERTLLEHAGADPRVEVITIQTCPEGWAGKNNAVWTAVHQAEGARDAELLLFADADTVFDPALVRAAVAMRRERGLDLLSLLSRLTHDRWYERRIQPAAAFELVRQYPLDYVNRARRPRAFANGQFMLFTRELYERVGGHEAVKDQLLEDIAFARLLDKRKRRMSSRWGVLLPGDGVADPASGMLGCRMYRDYAAFRRGWKRIYAEAALRRPGQLLEWAWRLRFTGGVLPLGGLGALFAAPWLFSLGHTGAGFLLLGCGLAGAGIAATAILNMYQSQRAPLRLALLYPIAALRVANLLAESARDLREGRRTVWGGLEYVRKVTP